jgi:hypothetical protein
MKYWTLYGIALFLLSGVSSFGQNKQNRQKVEAAKIGFITSRLNLTSAQATQFWPVYNDFIAKRKENRSRIRDLKDENESLATTDDKLLDNLKEIFVYRKREIEIETEYFEKFKRLITPRQIAELYKAEQDFTKILLSKLEEGEK